MMRGQDYALQQNKALQQNSALEQNGALQQDGGGWSWPGERSFSIPLA